MIHSFYAGKMQHSVWVAEAVSNHEVANANLASAVPADVFPKQFSFHRIWQGKGAQTAACKVSMCPYWSLVFLNENWITESLFIKKGLSSSFTLY